MAIEIKGMAPLLQVFDMPASIVFYRDVLGFQVVATSQPGEERFGWALLRLHGVELMLNTAYEDDSRPAEPDPARIAAHDDTARSTDNPSVALPLGRAEVRTRTSSGRRIGMPACASRCANAASSSAVTGSRPPTAR